MTLRAARTAAAARRPCAKGRSATTARPVSALPRASRHSAPAGVDTTPPQTTIDSGPSGPTNDPTPSFGFSSSEPGSTFECRVDAAAFAGCTSPFTSNQLSDGAHTFEVRATDAADQRRPQPRLALLHGRHHAPADDDRLRPLGDDQRPDPDLRLLLQRGRASFECRVDSGGLRRLHRRPTPPLALATAPTPSRSAPPTRPATPTRPPPSAPSRSTPRRPQTTIDSGPSGPTNDSTPTFGFSSSEAGASFECRVDSAGFAACTSHATPATSSPTAPTPSRSAPPTRPATSTPPPPRAASPSTRRPPIRRSTPARQGPTNDPTPDLRLLQRGRARASSAAWTPPPSPPAPRRHTTARSPTAPTPSRSAPPTRPPTPTRPRPAQLHRRHLAPADDDRLRPGRDRPTTRPRPSASPSEAGRELPVPRRLGALRRLLGAPRTAPHARRRRPHLRGPRHRRGRQRRPDPGLPHLHRRHRRPRRRRSTPAPRADQRPDPELRLLRASPARASSAASTSAAFAACSLAPHRRPALRRRPHLRGPRHRPGRQRRPDPGLALFTVDTAPPQTTIDSRPRGTTNDPTPSFGFLDEAGSSFQCRVDSGAFGACSAPVSQRPRSPTAPTPSRSAPPTGRQRRPDPGLAKL